MQVFHRDQFLGPLLFLIYINDLPNGLQSSLKLFADGTSLFSTAHDITVSTVNLNHYLLKNSEWTILILLLENKVNKYYLVKKISFKTYLSLHFNDNSVHQDQLQKHLGLLLDPKSSLDEHI